LSGEPENLLRGLDYSVLQQCMHCGMCLPSCPTYEATLNERSSPRGRIAMMRAIADGRLDMGKTFAEELYFCLGCLACESACPAGVDYATLFEKSRAQIERSGLLDSRVRSLVRTIALRMLFVSRFRLHLFGRALFLLQRSGIVRILHASGVLRLFSRRLHDLLPLSPRVQWRTTRQHFSSSRNPDKPEYRVGLLSGCIQDLAFSEVNRDTIEVLQENRCEVVLPRRQQCCGSLHGHNGESELAKTLAVANIEAFEAEHLDAIIVNSGGCGSHMRHYDRLLSDSSEYASRARCWSAKVRDIHEFLVEIGFRSPDVDGTKLEVTYHDSCHLRHGQKVHSQPRQVLAAIPGLHLTELTESDWCCGSAGIYNITQPEMSMQLLSRKIKHVASSGAGIVATGNPGCAIQLQHGLRLASSQVEVRHPVSLLADAYRSEVRDERKEIHR
jgi:glycolate oxidase iron-sulfur subunit